MAVKKAAKKAPEKASKRVAEKAPRKKQAAQSAEPPAEPPAEMPVDQPARDNMEFLQGISTTLTVELGRTRETLDTALEWGDQSLIELDKSVGEPVDILLNGELFARGEVVTVSENFWVRVTEIVNPV